MDTPTIYKKIDEANQVLSALLKFRQDVRKNLLTPCPQDDAERILWALCGLLYDQCHHVPQPLFPPYIFEEIIKRAELDNEADRAIS